MTTIDFASIEDIVFPNPVRDRDHKFNLSLINTYSKCSNNTIKSSVYHTLNIRSWSEINNN